MRPQSIIINPVNGWNRVAKPHRIRAGQVVTTQNYYPEFGTLKKVQGTERYANSNLGVNKPVTWTHRYYGRNADGTETKKLFAFHQGTFYEGNDVARTFTANLSGLSPNTYPSHEIIQVAGNARLYIFNEGEDVPYYTDNGVNFQKSAITQKFVQGVAWLDKLWAFEKNSNSLLYSVSLNPENFTDSTDAGEIIIGVSKREIIIGLIRFLDTLYVFTDRKIYRVEGRTVSTFAIREVHSELGLASRLSLITARFESGDQIVFLGDDFEIYSFGGTQSSTLNLTKEINFKTLVSKNAVNKVVSGFHNDLLRISYEPKEEESTTVYNSNELIANMLDLNDIGLPKWGMAKGTRVSCYTVQNKYYDVNELLTGRSDQGYVMFHGRTRNFDGSSIETIVRTGDILLSNRQNARIWDIYIDAITNGDNTVTLRTYLDGKISDYSVDNYNQKGETIALGLVEISEQIHFRERIQPEIGLSLCQTFAIELYNNDLNKDIQIQTFDVGVKSKDKKLSQTVGD